MNKAMSTKKIGSSQRPWSNKSNISPSSEDHSCSVKCWIRLTTFCTVLGAALCALRRLRAIKVLGKQSNISFARGFHVMSKS